MIRPVILSGGGGTRLWPLSRSGNPKQFQSIVGDQSLLQATVRRCASPLFHAPLISAGEEQRSVVIDQLEAVGIAPAAVLLEPAPRNTAPAIAAAAHWALARGEDDPLLVMPSDHLIKDVAALEKAVEAALPAALEGNLLTFGIRPTRRTPATAISTRATEMPSAKWKGLSRNRTRSVPPHSSRTAAISGTAAFSSFDRAHFFRS